MKIVFDKPITILRIDDETEKWEKVYACHAQANKSRGSEYADAGAERSTQTLQFTVRYFKGLEAIQCNTQFYRIEFGGNVYNVIDYDDFMFENQTVKLTGVSL